MEYRDSFDLMDCPSNMKIGLCWHNFFLKNNNKWTFNITDHLMVDLKIVIALASITCSVDSVAYELHPRNENVFNDLINECQGFTL